MRLPGSWFSGSWNRRLWIAAALVAAGLPALPAQDKYDGPRPPKADVPYLLHATNMLETEAGAANEDKTKKEIIASVGGVSSPVRTPLAEPMFLLLSEKMAPEKLELYAMEVKNGRRQVVFPTDAKKAKEASRPRHLLITKLAPDLFRIELNEIIDNGEYCLSPSGESKVFCFQVY